MEHFSPQLGAVRRTLDASRLTCVANHPEVRPHLGGVGDIDLSQLVSNPANFSFEVEGGGFICIARAVGIYEVHSLFLPGARAGQTVPAMRQAMAYMFTATDCIELVTQLPDGNQAAANLAKVGGFELRFSRQRCWQTAEGMIDAEWHHLTVERWALNAQECRSAGHKFHVVLEQAKSTGSSILATHPDDKTHDAIAGAALMMAEAGNVGKGVIFYNLWASVAGYALITLISVNPPVVDVLDALVELRDKKIEVLLCR